MPGKDYIKFDVNTVPLQGKNLVEASAGTGKTFSVGILVLRLVLEKNINIDKILLVTFTNNAVAELEERIRKFVRDAHDYALYAKNTDVFISQVVTNATHLSGEETVRQRLKDAVLFLDQLSVMTIHGFCKQCLNNLAFETGQLFGMELTTNMAEVYELYVKDFWRSHINTLPLDIYRVVREGGFTPGSIKDIIGKYFAGKKFFLYNPEVRYNLRHLRDSQACSRILTAMEEARKDFDACLKKNAPSLAEAMALNRYAKTHLRDLESADLMWKLIDSKRDKKYIEQIFADTLLPCYDAYHEKVAELELFTQDLMNNIYCFALQEIPNKISGHIQTAGIVSFDGLIKNLHSAITGNNKELIVQALQSQYDAVFVDEFQDTDKLQYEIFKTAFHDGTILFYIGDPKQSIYSFRQADINTYLASYDDVDKRYSMNTNFRSGSRLVQALNEFFLPTPDFDTFYFDGEDNKIGYVSVEANDDGAKEFLCGKEAHHPLTIEKCKNNSGIKNSVVSKIYELLTDNRFVIRDGEKERPVRPSDIGILVAGNKCGKEIKALLNQRNIPAIIMNDDKIMQSQEAITLYHVLRAMHNPTVENINAALVNHFTGKRASEIKIQKKEELVEVFRDYKATWESRGINQALSAYISDFGIRDYLINPETINGLRIISNLEQLKELLIKTEYLQRLNPDELMDWMKRAKDLELVDEDEGVIRLENDADAVTIITIHRSKGLQYNIVFSPESDLLVRKCSEQDLVDLYENGSYILLTGNQLSEAQLQAYEVQSRQEKRRLLYVALTRAVYACFVYHSERNLDPSKSTISPFLANRESSDLIRFTTSSPEGDEQTILRYQADDLKRALPETLAHEFSPLDPYWQFMSYSGLAAEHELPVSPAVSPTKTNFDSFVFEKLRRGSITGTLLHEILEKVDFQSAERHIFQIRSSVARYASSNADVYTEYLPQMIAGILDANISIGERMFQLNQIPRNKRLHELEFNFSVQSFNTAELTRICADAGVPVALINRSELYGIMNGFIDMFFELDGRYYILDWKSNFLGSSTSDYAGESLENAMAANNYHLQYLIYTIAANKYLQQRLHRFDYETNFGGVIYCFLRGMRAGELSGIYTTRPSLKIIKALSRLVGRANNQSAARESI